MSSLFVFTIIAPEGALHAHFQLEPGCCSSPGDVQVEWGEGRVPHAHTLTVAATRLPSQMEFCELAAYAATKNANVSPNPLSQLLNLLIPF
ncbi:hypothetical protein E5F05_02495 (plasmid) [Deinococcus metallilatus]|uniref:Uncharacterized protein n=1 Tax=Deinococcus metallilatus TaxID=1211322 RepID=A0ABR6MUY6_9DEIO|nr:hypothetical protein [Deinococcus metallilatus]MBB5295728.1 hypothetical protein [Deinococcus metallilatus]QBY06825.1 hypothetical protein E5F05_02495 [Deinococcus metallilatus]GMA14258.1 hypothetical protein GCM10025871_05890 [Deinococcus metallilatus]